MIFNRRPLASSSEDEKMSSMIRAEASAVNSAGCARNRKPALTFERVCGWHIIIYLDVGEFES